MFTHCKIIVTNSDVKLIDFKIGFSGISFWVSAYLSLQEKKLRSYALWVSADAYQKVRLRDSSLRLRKWVNTEFVWEFKRDSVEADVSRDVRLQERPLR